MDHNAFTKTDEILNKLKDILKCQSCSELKSSNLIFYYKSCGHFYCIECGKSKNSCVICIDSQDIPLVLKDDKNMISFYESISNLKLPSRKKMEDILADCQSEFSSVVNSIENYKKLPLTMQKKKVNTKQKTSDSLNDQSEAMSKQSGKINRASKNLLTNNFNKLDTPIKCNELNATTNNNQKTFTNKKKFKNHKGESLLHLACKRECISDMKKLIDAGADVNAQDNAGWTPLHDSVVKGNLNVIQLLLQSGAKVNMPGFENNTPLHEAVLNMNDKICELLMKYGADYKSKNLTGDTPLDIAKNFNNLELQEILLHTKSNLIFNLEYEKPLDADEKGYYQIVIWKCQLNEIEEEGTKKFVQEFEVEVANTYPFCSEKPVSHIIIPQDRKVTLNWAIISSVVSGSWIVNSQWIFDSLKDKTLKPLKGYALQNEFFSGFEKSRLNKVNQLPGLFSGCHFFFYGSLVNYYVGKIKIMKDHVSSLVKKNGGVVLKRAPDPERFALERTVPYHASEKSSVASTCYFIIYQRGKNEPGCKYNMSHIKTLPIDWLILCIFKFRLIDPEETDHYLKELLQE